MPRIAWVAVLSLGLSGCVFLPGRGHYKPAARRSAVTAKDCKKNQEWDGKRCRHKGKGSGARKHDD